jgi:hypothetical protein
MLSVLVPGNIFHRDSQYGKDFLAAQDHFLLGFATSARGRDREEGRLPIRSARSPSENMPMGPAPMQSVRSPIARPRYSSDTAVITIVDCVLPKNPEPNAA